MKSLKVVNSKFRRSLFLNKGRSINLIDKVFNFESKHSKNHFFKYNLNKFKNRRHLITCCSNHTLTFQTNKQIQKFNFEKCRDFFCLNCEKFKQNKLLFFINDELVKHEKEYDFYFITLTFPNIHFFKNLNDEYKRVAEAFKLFKIRYERTTKHKFNDYFLKKEITTNWNTKSYNLHFHLVKAYKKDIKIDYKLINQLWLNSYNFVLKTDLENIITDVKEVKKSKNGQFGELTKYVSKSKFLFSKDEILDDCERTIDYYKNKNDEFKMNHWTSNLDVIKELKDYQIEDIQYQILKFLSGKSFISTSGIFKLDKKIFEDKLKLSNHEEFKKAYINFQISMDDLKYQTKSTTKFDRLLSILILNQINTWNLLLNRVKERLKFEDWIEKKVNQIWIFAQKFTQNQITKDDFLAIWTLLIKQYKTHQNSVCEKFS